MNLSDEQKAIVSKWIAEGTSLSDVQSRLRAELGVAITYMEARLLMADLNLTPVEKKTEDTNAPVSGDLAKPEAAAEEEEAFTPPAAGGVHVSIDHITKPNALISGKVTFSDGQNGEWALDSMGRLALNPSTAGYRPSPEDITAFQVELQRMAKSQGF